MDFEEFSEIPVIKGVGKDVARIIYEMLEQKVYIIRHKSTLWSSCSYRCDIVLEKPTYDCSGSGHMEVIEERVLNDNEILVNKYLEESVPQYGRRRVIVKLKNGASSKEYRKKIVEIQDIREKINIYNEKQKNKIRALMRLLEGMEES